MNQPIRVEMDETPDRDELVAYLTERGLVCTPVTNGGRCDIEVAYALEPEERLHVEVSNALRAWLAEHERPLIAMPVGDDSFVLRPPGD